MRNNIWDGPRYEKRGAKYFHISLIPSIPCAPRWVSKTMNDIWFCNIVGLYIDTSKLKWIFRTFHHSVLLIDMLLKLSRNLSTRTNGSLVLQIHNNRSMKKMDLTIVSWKPVQDIGKEGSWEDKEGHQKMVWFPQNPLAQHRWMSLKIVIGGCDQRQGFKPSFII